MSKMQQRTRVAKRQPGLSEKSVDVPTQEIGIDVRHEQEFIGSLNYMMHLANAINEVKGWNRPPVATDAENCALVHSEVSEILEYLRNPLDGVYQRPDDKIPEFLGVEAEGADIIIRLLSWYKRRGWRLAEAVCAKLRYNMGREYRHGGKAL